ncbi:VOC family protein [Nocardia sp. NPDC050175]|uniref:VOC family protein n=1 Tax=Nocardia sp. NPDC050175 TaxID=3364317 RepID=UPI0037AFF436
MLPDSRIVYLFLYVKDLAVSREWFEHKLGLRVLEEDADSVKYDCGTAILALNKADDYGIELATERDHSTDIVFLVDNLDHARAALEARGIEFTETHRYEIGAITDFYDPDNHWFTLYETSDESLTWPSGDRIQAVRAKLNGKTNGHSASADLAAFTLADKPLIYLFLFVRDAADAFLTYADRLGIRDIEGGPCSRASTADEDGVIKYDTGGMILSTHHLETIRPEEQIVDHPCPPRTVNPRQMHGKAIVFHTPDLDATVTELSAKGMRFDRINRSSIGAIAESADSSGHVFYLWEPSEEALQSPSGERMKELLATTYEPA